MATLITVPCFNFEQGDAFDQEVRSERPIEVKYYNDNIITLEQGGNEIIIQWEYF